MNYVEVQLEVNLLLDKNDLNYDEKLPPDKEKIISYINRKLRTDCDLLGKITEKNIIKIYEKIQKSTKE